MQTYILYRYIAWDSYKTPLQKNSALETKNQRCGGQILVQRNKNNLHKLSQLDNNLFLFLDINAHLCPRLGDDAPWWDVID